jgi:hypothetical protein
MGIITRMSHDDDARPQRPRASKDPSLSERECLPAAARILRAFENLLEQIERFGDATEEMREWGLDLVQWAGELDEELDWLQPAICRFRDLVECHIPRPKK